MTPDNIPIALYHMLVFGYQKGSSYSENNRIICQMVTLLPIPKGVILTEEPCNGITVVDHSFTHRFTCLRMRPTVVEVGRGENVSVV